MTAGYSGCVGKISSADVLQSFQYRGGHHLADVAAMPGNFLNETGAEKGMFLAGYKKNCLERIVQISIDQSHLQFIFKIADGPQPFNNDGGGIGDGKINQKIIEW